MKKVAVYISTAICIGLTGCDSASVATAPNQSQRTSANNSDARKASFQPPTAADKAILAEKMRKILAISSDHATAFPARAAAISPTIAYLIDPPKYGLAASEKAYYSNMFRVFFDTENDGNADQVASGGWDVARQTTSGNVLSSRSNPKVFAWYDVNTMVTGQLDQNTGIPGLRYTGIQVTYNTNPGSIILFKGPWTLIAPTNPPITSGNGTPPYFVSSTTWDNGPTEGLSMYFMPKQMDVLPRLQADYIVLRLSDKCPDNGVEFSQWFDDEDTNNQDITSRDIYPGFFSRPATTTKLAFCFVPAAAPGTADHNFGNAFDPEHSIGIFTNPSNPGAAGLSQVNTLAMDSEDDDFAGFFDWEGHPEIAESVKKIMPISSAAQTPFLSVGTTIRYGGAVGVLTK